MAVSQHKSKPALLRLMYDVSVVSMALSDDRSKTGIYRVVSEVLSELQKMDAVHIEYSHTAFPYHIEKTEAILGKKINTQPKYRLPRSLFGRGKEFLREFYSFFNIDINEVLYDETSFAEADIFHTPFKKIPDILKSYQNLERVITIYDIIPIKFSKYHTLKPELEEIIESIGKDYAICISNHTRNDLLEYDSTISPENVFVSHLAADPHKFYPCQDSEKIREVREKYQLPENYFLSLCTLEPRKNLVQLIRCFIQFIEEQHIKDLKLVLVGTKGWNFDQIFNEIVDANKHRDRIIVTGRVPDEDLAAIYSNAHSFYYLSLYEGFGLPPLEAMQCGTASVTSNISSLPEVVEDGGIMVDPENEDDICDAMYKLYTNHSFKKEMVSKGLQQAEKFSWQKTAQQHLDIYHQILDKK